MVGHDGGLIVRRVARYDLVLPAALRVAEEHADVVRFGPRAGDRDGWVDADLMDMGVGGAGLICPLFFPRGARVKLRVWALADREGEPILELAGKVVRTTMTDRRPAYMVGIGFDAFSPVEEEAIGALVGRLAGQEDAHEPD